MMITAHKKNRHTKKISAENKQDIALKSLDKSRTITSISEDHNCSRTTVYKQKSKIISAANEAFKDEEKEPTFLFNFPVKKSTICIIVLALFLICKSSYRDIKLFLKFVFDYDISLGNIFNILDDASGAAESINNSYDISKITDVASDEMFHRNKPVLNVVDIKSRFCILSTKEKSRDADTWGIRLLELQDEGFNPNVSIIDQAKGLRNAYEYVLPDTQLRFDHFHMIMKLKDCARFLNNRVKSIETEEVKLFIKLQNSKDEAAIDTLEKEFETKEQYHQQYKRIATQFKTLSQWLQHDVLQLPGLSVEDREELYDFIVEQMQVLAEEHPHRIKEVVASLINQKDALLSVIHELAAKLEMLTKKHNVNIKILWDICYLFRCSSDSINYNLKVIEIEKLIGDKYDLIEDDIREILEGTHRCSSMIENYNSRIRPYLSEMKSFSQIRLNLIRFYLNHKPFLRAANSDNKGKTPAEILTGKTLRNWIELLGFQSFKRNTI